MNFNKKLAVAVSGAVLLMAGQAALADSATDIVDALVSKGVLTEEEGKLITKGHTSKTSVTPVVKEKDGAFTLSSPNGKNSIQLTGRLHFDYRNSDINSYGAAGAGNYGTDYDRDSASTADHFLIRRARIGVKGRLGGIADYEVVGNLPGTATLDVAYLDFNKYEPLSFRFGKFKQPYNLEEQTSSNNIDFVERSYINQNAPGKKLGAMLHGQGKGVTYAGSIYQMNDDATSTKDKDMSYAGRGTLNFAELMDNKDMVLHVGVAGFDAEYQIAPALSNNTGDNLVASETRGTVFGFRSAGGGLSNLYRAQIAGTTVGTGFGYGNTSPTTSSVKARALGLEGIVAYNNFKIQGEYSRADYKANANGRSSDPVESISADVDTAYIEALWIVTGEKYSDSYKKGAFGSIKPKSEFNFDTGSGYGAWELGVRYEMFDVTDTNHTGTGISRFQGTVNGGSALDSGQTCKVTNATCDANGGAKTTTVGIKWVMNPNMLFKANWAHTSFDNAYKPIDLKNNDTQKNIGSEDLIMIRGQYMF
jgi:phosphate-selective porin OprO/OprP